MININRLTIRPRNLHIGCKISLLLLMVFLLASCTEPTDNNKLAEIKVEVFYNQEPLYCGQELIIDGNKWAIQQLAFFVSELKTGKSGLEQTLSLSSNEWQNDGLALLQWFDCAAQPSHDENKNEQGNAAYRATLQLAQVQDFSQINQLRFTLGIPFDLNHLNPLSQNSPLNIPSMFWSWRSGHKFFRLDMQAQQQSWVFHLGSIGCTADSAMRSPQLSCAEPNRIEFNLQKQQEGRVLVLHLDRLLNGLDLHSQSACLMQPLQASCQVLMTNMANNQVFEWQ